MITTAQLTTVLADGAAVLDEDDIAIGRLEQIFVDDRTGMPEWVTARVGAVDCFIPLAEAIADGKGLHVPYSRAQVTQAPPPRLARGHLSGSQESRLFHYYGLQWLETPQELESSGAVTAPRQVQRSVRMRLLVFEDEADREPMRGHRRAARERSGALVAAAAGASSR